MAQRATDGRGRGRGLGDGGTPAVAPAASAPWADGHGPGAGGGAGADAVDLRRLFDADKGGAAGAAAASAPPADDDAWMQPPQDAAGAEAAAALAVPAGGDTPGADPAPLGALPPPYVRDDRWADWVTERGKQLRALCDKRPTWQGKVLSGLAGGWQELLDGALAYPDDQGPELNRMVIFRLRQLVEPGQMRPRSTADQTLHPRLAALAYFRYQGRPVANFYEQTSFLLLAGHMQLQSLPYAIQIMWAYLIKSKGGAPDGISAQSSLCCCSYFASSKGPRVDKSKEHLAILEEFLQDFSRLLTECARGTRVKMERAPLELGSFASSFVFEDAPIQRAIDAALERNARLLEACHGRCEQGEGVAMLLKQLQQMLRDLSEKKIFGLPFVNKSTWDLVTLASSCCGVFGFAIGGCCHDARLKARTLHSRYLGTPNERGYFHSTKDFTRAFAPKLVAFLKDALNDPFVGRQVPAAAPAAAAGGGAAAAAAAASGGADGAGVYVRM